MTRGNDAHEKFQKRNSNKELKERENRLYSYEALVCGIWQAARYREDSGFSMDNCNDADPLVKRIFAKLRIRSKSVWHKDLNLSLRERSE